MIEETAIIVSLEGNYAWLEKQRQSSCGSCAMNKGCGTAVLGKVFENRFVKVRAINQANAQVGDTVIVGLEEGAMVKAAFILYLLPLLTMLLAALVIDSMTQNLESGIAGLWVGMSAITAFGLTFVMIRKYFLSRRGDSHYEPVVLRQADNRFLQPETPSHI